MLRTIFLIFAFVGAISALAAKPVPLRLVSFDPTVRKVGKSDAQQATLALVEGRKAGKTYTVHLQPSEKTAALVSRELYLRLPLSWLNKKDFVFYAGELLDLEPAHVPADFFVETPIKEDVADKDGIIERYTAGRIALDGINEVNGTFLPPIDPNQWTTADEAIAAAQRIHPDGVRGAFVFVVRGSDEENTSTMWLNSETNYRNSQSLNVSLPWTARKDLELRLKEDPVTFLKGKKVVVSGIARRVKISTGNKDFYYQTQIQLWSAHQLRIVP